MPEKRNLAIGNYRITWSREDYVTLVATIKVTDIGINCLSVTGGSCNQTTPPGLTINGWMFTGYLKPIPITKTELISELGKKGEIDVSKVSNLVGYDKWYMYGGQLIYQLAGKAKAITIAEINVRNPPTQVGDIQFIEDRISVSELAKSWVLEQLAKLPYPIEEKITKAELITEMGRRGAVDLTKVPTSYAKERWYMYRGILTYVGSQKGIAIRNVSTRNPPTQVGDIQFIEDRISVSELEAEWVIARLAELPYGAAPEKKTVTFDSVPIDATVIVKAL